MKQCTLCEETKPLDEFYKDAKPADGLTRRCKTCCKRIAKEHYDRTQPQQVRNAYLRKQRRFEQEPAYKKAFRLWNHAYMRTHIVGSTSIVDFVPICKKALRLGPEYEIDHIVPLKGHPDVCGLHVPWNLRVVKRKTNRKKGRKFLPEVEERRLLSNP